MVNINEYVCYIYVRLRRYVRCHQILLMTTRVQVVRNNCSWTPEDNLYMGGLPTGVGNDFTQYGLLRCQELLLMILD